ncbi:MAG: hypothetical protein OCU18_03960 [Candidatus Syntrophoarchaeum sp.]|nr:hypothetical protein [Candidatus Syntrophoarchaeum sp.]
MPLYDCMCNRCGKEFEAYASVSSRKNIRCECGGTSEILITNHKTKDWFKPHVNEHFNGKPIEVRSRRHLKELCKKFNVTSRAIGDVR